MHEPIDRAGKKSGPQLPPPGLFSLLFEIQPEYKQIFEGCRRRIAERVERDGGHLVIQTEGPAQGITIETNGRIYRISPALVDERDRAVVAQIQASHAKGLPLGELTDPLLQDVVTLRFMMTMEVSLREQPIN